MSLILPLHPIHQKTGAKFINFAGFEMPLQYEGILPEHHAVRHAAGLFDVSHMGKIDITGKDTIPFLDYLSTNTIIHKPMHHAVYTVFCNDHGGSVDDLLVFLLDPSHAFVVANAANREKDLAHLNRLAGTYDVQIKPRYNDTGILALQGPESYQILQKLISLPPLKHMEVIALNSILVSRTGYTGEEGYELFIPYAHLETYWNKLIAFSKPCGLGARDLLRLEMGYALYGHELSEMISPLESVSAWTVKEHNFYGKAAMKRKRHPIALVGIEKPIAREGYPIYLEDENIGVITSGSFSPSLQKPIALGLVDRVVSTHASVEIRGKRYPFESVKLPFVKHSGTGMGKGKGKD